jgi:hypothetical protein
MECLHLTQCQGLANSLLWPLEIFGYATACLGFGIRRVYHHKQASV